MVRRVHATVHLPIALYAVTSSLFMPVFQSLVYRKACIGLSNTTSAYECEDEASTRTARDQRVQEEANWVVMWSSAAMCIGSIVSSMALGWLGDNRSHRQALLVPLSGLVLSDLLLLLQLTHFPSSTCLLVLAEAVFGLCGGYVSIFSASFAYASLRHKDDEGVRSVSIARLEGCIGLGSVVGLLISSLLSSLYYVSLFLFCLVVHVICIGTVVVMEDGRKEERRGGHPLEATVLFVRGAYAPDRPLCILLCAFFVCFFAFIGSSHILFFYLKHRFTMTIGTYGVYRAIEKALSTATALFLYPLLKQRLHWSTVTLALLGMGTRAAAKLSIAVAWSKRAVFMSLVPEAFSRFAASALRSLMATQARPDEQGRLFSFVAALEALCNLLAVFFFHSLFPWSLPIMSQLSFLVMAALIIPAALALCSPLRYHRSSIDKPPSSSESTSSASIAEKEEGKEGMVQLSQA